MNILILGAGMYVTGRAGSGIGTVLNALAQTSKEVPINSVTVIAKNPHNKKNVLNTANRINRTIKASLKVHYESKDVYKPAFLAFLKTGHYDAAIICVPDHLHFQAAKQLMERGIHCLVVKPLTPNLKEAKLLLTIQKRNKIYGAVEFHKRFDETNLYIKRALDEKVLGDILYFSVDYSQRIDIPLVSFRHWASKTNIFQYLGVHYVDLIFFLTGYIPSRAMAVGTQKILIKKGVKTFDSIHAIVEWRHPHRKQDVFISQFNTNWIDPNNTSALSDQKYKIIGTRGRIECDQKNRGLELVHERLGIRHINPYFSEYLYNPNGQLEFGGYGHKSINLFVKDVHDLLEGRTDIDTLERNRPTFRHSLVSTAVIEAVCQSLENKSQWRKISDLF